MPVKNFFAGLVIPNAAPAMMTSSISEDAAVDDLMSRKAAEREYLECVERFSPNRAQSKDCLAPLVPEERDGCDQTDSSSGSWRSDYDQCKMLRACDRMYGQDPDRRPYVNLPTLIQSAHPVMQMYLETHQQLSMSARSALLNQHKKRVQSFLIKTQYRRKLSEYFS